MAETVDLPPNVAAQMQTHAMNGAQLAADDARDIRRESHLTHQTTKVLGGAIAGRAALESGSGRTRAETNAPYETGAGAPGK